MRGALTRFAMLTVVVLIPSLASAQGTLTGTVRDGSGAVIPGVTVEASSEALIERMRTVVSDSTGQWRIVDLRPGIYAVTFMLDGFTTVRREGIELTGPATLTIPVEMTVGNIQETVTVFAETPVVDVQSVQREVVLQTEFVNSLPATRNYAALLSSIPALTVGVAISAETTPTMQLFTARGGSANEGRITVDGMTVAAPFNGGGVSSVAYNVNDVTELQVLISGGLGESETGGPRLNIIPRSGGNRFAGTAFMNTSGEWSRSENIDDELRGYGITRGPALKASWDVSGSYGGPIRRDRLWFYGTVRNYQTARIRETAIPGNIHAGDPGSWAFALDESIEEVRDVQSRDIFSGRLTGQVAKHRITFSREQQYRCDGTTLTTQGSACRERGASWTGLGGTTTSPEAHAGYFPQPYYVTQATWTMPKTNRLLLEAGFSRLAYEPVFGRPASDSVFDLIPVLEQAAIDGHRANTTYRAIGSYISGDARNNNVRASATYVTGAHNLKVGYQGAFQLSDQTSVQNPSLISYRFNQRSPNQFTINLPDWQTAGRTIQHSAYVQDSWTVNRFTIQGALRFDHAYSWSPAEGNGTLLTSQWNSEPITFERTVSVRGYDDITARMGIAYDVFGTGKTALKVNLGKYLDAATNDSNYTRNNPANRIQRTMTRSWTDNNGDKVVDCDILNLQAQGPTNANPALRTVDTCAAVTGNSARFADVAGGLTQVNPAILGGWGVRPYDWQTGLAIQQELLPRVSVEVAYNRRWWGNFFVTDNLTLGPDDYKPWVVTAPVDPRLPGGGGYEIVRWVQKPESAGPAQNYVTFETDYGPARTNYWHGVEVTGNARMRNGLTFQGGTSTGREVTDRCDTVVKIDSPDPRNCKTAPPFRTNFRGSAAYTVPRVDVLVSTITRISPAPQLSANIVIPNTVFRDEMGHLPVGGTANGNQTVPVLDDTTRLYATRRHYQFDMRFAKVLRMSGKRADIGVDLYNIFNVNTPVAYDGTYDLVPAEGRGPGGEWLWPTTIVQPRFARFNFTLNF